MCKKHVNLPKTEGILISRGKVKFWWTKIGKIFGKRYNLGNFPRSQKSFRKQGGSETGGNVSLPQGGWTPLAYRAYDSQCILLYDWDVIDAKVLGSFREFLVPKHEPRKYT